MHTLPDAVQREREALLRDAVGILKIHGYQPLAVQDLAGYKEPDEIIIPVLNVPMKPDIMASNWEKDGLMLGVVVVSTDLGEESCGRRWQAFSAWAQNHNTDMQVFVHQEDIDRATAIAEHWHLSPELLISVQRTH